MGRLLNVAAAHKGKIVGNFPTPHGRKTKALYHILKDGALIHFDILIFRIQVEICG